MQGYKEWIIKYSGDLGKILQGTNAMVDTINERYAIIKVSDKEILYLNSLTQIEHMEEARPMCQIIQEDGLEQVIFEKKQKQSINRVRRTIGWISHKEKINYSPYKKFDKDYSLCVHNGTKEYNERKTMVIGSNRIPLESDVILVNWQKDNFNTSDAIRAIRFIIRKRQSIEEELLIYFPFDVTQGAQSNLTYEIISDMTLNRQIIIESNLGQLQNLLLPTPVLEGFRILEIAKKFAPDDAIIDVFVVYNSFSPEPIITTPQETNLYPLVFPYLGARGTVREMITLIEEGLENMAIGSLAPILGNEPFDITPTDFRAVSISKSPTPLKGKGILIGIIDTGIDYTNPVFIDSNGESRIVSIWDQTIGSSSPYGYGTIYDQEIINKALKSPDPFAVVPHKDESGHGTMLAGIAAGAGNYENGKYTGIAPDVQIVIVKLAPATPAMQEIYYSQLNPFGFSGLDIARAIQYVTNVGIQQGKPISICLASGTNSGSHDGASVLDQVLNIYGQNLGVSIVLPAGEEANKGHHASGNLSEGKEQEIKLTLPKGQEGFMIEIWAEFGDRFEVSLTPPKVGDVVSVILLNKAQTYPLPPGTSFVWSEGSTIDIDTGCQVIRFRLADPVEGDWIIRIKGIVIIAGLYNIWIPKTGMILPRTVLSPADPFATIYSTSSAQLLTVGCYDERSQSSTASSGRGFTRDGRVKPDFVVSGVNIFGPLPDKKWGLITGTTAASAITAGVAALIYEDQIKQGMNLANTTAMRAILVANAKREPTIDYPNPSTGYGLLDINQPFIIKDVTR